MSQGCDSSADTFIVRSPDPRFATAEMGSHFRSSNDGYGFSRQGSAASTGFAASCQGSWEQVNDLRSPGGRVPATALNPCSIKSSPPCASAPACSPWLPAKPENGNARAYGTRGITR